MTKPAQLHVVLGRFQPAHRSHVKLIESAMQEADSTLVIIGSAHRAPDCKNPFTWEERQHMIGGCLPTAHNIVFRPLRDSRYDNDDWFRATELTVQRHAATISQGRDVDVTLFGVRKPNDDSTWYLDRFPNWKHQRIPSTVFKPMDATKVRDLFFEDKDYWTRFVHAPVRNFLNSWIDTELGRNLAGEHRYLMGEAKRARRYPYKLTFTTADAVVFWRESILLIRRKGELGRGLWALPGGFIDAEKETCYQSAKREAQEETGIELRDEWCLTQRGGDVYDDPNRSLRGRTITHAYMFRIPDEIEVPAVHGGDDAGYACWYPLKDIPGLECRLFEDHIDIIRGLTRKTGIPQPNWRPELGI
jgi:bifunctional NMN adenylyltransferase/nudix hydrolase